MSPPVSAIADVLALRGLGGWLTPPLHPVVAPGGPLAGRLRLVRLGVVARGGSLAPIYELLSEPLDGRFVVLAGAQGAPGAVWGEILTAAARQQGAAGVLVDGAVRDVPDLGAIGLPLYAAGEAVAGPGGMVAVEAVDRPVTVGGVAIAPDDVVVADATGAVRVPAAQTDAVLAAAERYAAAEAQVLADLADGKPLVDAYHHKAALVAELARVQP